MDQGTTAFLLICAAMALLAAFAMPLIYGGGGSARRSGQAGLFGLGALSIVAVLWVAFGYAVAFGAAAAPGFLGIEGVLGIDTGAIGLGLAPDGAGGGGVLAFAAFQGVVACVAACILAAALPSRTTLPVAMAFIALWAALVYFPVSGWVFNMQWGVGGMVGGGWLVFGLESAVGAGVLDFAGALPVHIAAGAGALGLAIAGRCRKGHEQAKESAGGPSAVLLGSALLWFGWLGATAGAEQAADGIAALAVTNTLVAPAAAMLSWLLIEAVRGRKATARGAASGAVAGLVAISAGAGYLSPLWSLILGVMSGVVCALAVHSLAVRLPGTAGRIVGIHLVGGVFGALYLGIFAAGEGFLYSGGLSPLMAQLIGALSVAVYSLIVSYLLAKLLRVVHTLRRRPAPADDGLR